MLLRSWLNATLMTASTLVTVGCGDYADPYGDSESSAHGDDSLDVDAGSEDVDPGTTDDETPAGASLSLPPLAEGIRRRNSPSGE